MKNKTTKTLMLGITTVIIAIFLISFASAEFWACFAKGEKINYCVGGSIPGSTYDQPDKTCAQDMGCQMCMRSYYPDYDNGCYVHGSWPRCNTLAPECSDIGGDTEYDLTPPVLTIASPINNNIYSSKKVLLSFSLNEISDVYYRNLDKSGETWTRVCDNCNAGNPSYNMTRSFAEGENNLMFKAVDTMGNEATQPLKFKIDSLAPRIYKTYPLSGFASGDFEVQFSEANPSRVTLYYGGKSKNLNMASECIGPDKNKKINCETSVGLNEFNGQEITYYFEVEDITGKKYKSRMIKIKVDTTSPVMNNPNSFYSVSGRYATFNMSIADANFYKVTYTELSAPNTVKVLCTRLTNGYCYKKQSFLPGTHTLSIQITDKAGHSIALPASFTI